MKSKEASKNKSIKNSEKPLEEGLEPIAPIANMIRAKLPDREHVANEIVELIEIQFRQSTFHAGPLPPPSMLAEYEKVVPGLAAQIADQSKGEQAFRHKAIFYDLETTRESMQRNANQISRGQFFGFSLGLLLIGAGIFFIAVGKEISGLTALVTSITGLTIAFITGNLANPVKKDGKEEGQQDKG